MEVTMVSPVNHQFFVPLLPQEDMGNCAVTFGLIIDGVACGCAQFIIQGHSARLVHLLVDGQYRRGGGGTHLLKESIRHLWQYGLSQVLCHPIYLPWDENSYLGFFLTHCGFTEEAPTAWVYTAPLSSFAYRLGTAPQGSHMVPLTHFPAHQWGALATTLKKSPHVGEFEAMLRHPDFQPHLSIVVVENKALAGFCTVIEQKPHLLEIAGLCYLGESKTATLQLLSTSLKTLTTAYPDGVMITTLVNHPSMAHTLDKTLEGTCYTKQPVHQFTIHHQP